MSSLARCRRAGRGEVVAFESSQGLGVVAYVRTISTPPVTNYRNTLLDVLVHAQDIAIPLGRTIAVPSTQRRQPRPRCGRLGWPFAAQPRLPGVRLVATDVALAAGTGREVRGPIEALLLLLTARTVALPRLAGDGLLALTEPARRPSRPTRPNRAAHPPRPPR
jgi:hypothetical protein